MASWQEYKTYWLHKAEQGSDQWHAVRRGRPTASKFGACIGHSNFSSLEETAAEILGRRKVEDRNGVMAHGIETEPAARDWYQKTNRVTVREVGLVVPKWDPRIGASADGVALGSSESNDLETARGVIEIKCPKRMYRPLESHMERLAQGWVQPPGYHEHIWNSHYDQMQGVMAILGKQWCDYVVFCTPENKVFTERIPFDPVYWDRVIYPQLDNFIRTYLEPQFDETNRPMIPG